MKMRPGERQIVKAYRRMMKQVGYDIDHDYAAFGMVFVRVHKVGDAVGTTHCNTALFECTEEQPMHLLISKKHLAIGMARASEELEEGIARHEKAHMVADGGTVVPKGATPDEVEALAAKLTGRAH